MDHKPVTIKEIARKLKTSPSTVSRALRNHKNISQGTIERVQQLAKELNFEPNQAAISLQQRKSYTVGVVIPELSESFFSSAISGIENYANKNNYQVLVSQSHDDEEREKQLVSNIRKHGVDGLIISIAKNTSNYDHFIILKNLGIPIVFFDCIPNMPDIHYVACNITGGTMQAYKYLRKLGHKNIGMINGPQNLLASKERITGYRNALSKLRLKYDPSLIVSCDLKKVNVEKATEKLLSLKNRPTAIIVFNDYVLLDAVQSAKKLKLKINKDISFVSYANLPISYHSAYPPIASIEQFSYQQGQKSMEILLDLLSKDKHGNENSTFYNVILEPQLVIGSRVQ